MENETYSCGHFQFVFFRRIDPRVFPKDNLIVSCHRFSEVQPDQREAFELPRRIFFMFPKIFPKFLLQSSKKRKLNETLLFRAVICVPCQTWEPNFAWKLNDQFWVFFFFNLNNSSEIFVAPVTFASSLQKKSPQFSFEFRDVIHILLKGKSFYRIDARIINWRMNKFIWGNHLESFQINNYYWKRLMTEKCLSSGWLLNKPKWL